MLFDLFNRRNIPSVFAYASVAYGFVLTLLYLNFALIAVSIAIAAAVMGVGYLVYRAGMLGAGDVFEFAALSLVLPFQALPLIASTPQFGLPFIISLFIDSGIAALIIVPLYYIPKTAGKGWKGLKRIDKGASRKAMLVGSVYIIFIGFLALVAGAGVGEIILIAIIAFGSVSVIVFEKSITMMMVDYVTYAGFEEGDIMAWNLMKQSQVRSLRRKVRGFDRLITKALIAAMKKGAPREKVPVYKRAIPLAAPIFVGVVAAILFGNAILLLLVPI